MVQAQSTGHAGNSATPMDLQSLPLQFAEMGRKQFETMIEAQKQFLEAAEEMNRTWVAHTQLEANLVSDFIGKLASVRSLPDAASACQESMSRQLQVFTDDSRRLLHSGEKFMEAGAQALSNSGAVVSS